MSDNFELFNIEKHNKSFVQFDNDLPHLASQHVVVITPKEIAKAALNFPICFMKTQENGAFQMVAIMGLEAGSNAFYQDGKFNSIYMPFHIAKYPFALAKVSAEQVMMAIDSQVLNEDGEGEALFNEQGEPTEYLSNKKELLQELSHQEELTKAFIGKLQELGLLTEFSLKFDLGDGDKKQLSGLYSVDRELLQSLDSETLSELQKQGMLEAIYAHLISLGQFQRVIDLSAKK